MKDPVRLIDRQLPLWDNMKGDPPAILSQEQQKELLDTLADLLLSVPVSVVTGWKGRDDDAG